MYIILINKVMILLEEVRALTINKADLAITGLRQVIKSMMQL